MKLTLTVEKKIYFKQFDLTFIYFKKKFIH